MLGQAADGTDITGLGFREITVELHILDESITQRTLGGSGTMRRRTLIIAAWPLIALLGIAVAVKFAPQPAPLRVTVSFLGYTNDMTGAPLAKFAVSFSCQNSRTLSSFRRPPTGEPGERSSTFHETTGNENSASGLLACH